MTTYLLAPLLLSTPSFNFILPQFLQREVNALASATGIIDLLLYYKQRHSSGRELYAKTSGERLFCYRGFTVRERETYTLYRRKAEGNGLPSTEALVDLDTLTRKV
jgi:hypothetical protein